MKTFILIAMLAAAMFFALPAQAQSTRPADAGQDISRDSGLKDLGENMSRDRYETLINKANENRLKAERKLAAAEIIGGFSDPALSETVVAQLEENAANTQRDNIKRICEAFARIDKEKFGELYRLFNEKKYKEAVLKGRPMAAGNTQSTYLQAAKAFVYAQALEAAGGDYNEAADAYTDLVTNMTDRISFAAESVVKLAALYEKNGRGFYAMQTYTFMLKNYGLTMDAKSFDGMVARVKKLSEIYGDPMGTVAKMMSSVKERLARIDSGKETQLTEQQIVALLEELVKNAEDQNSQPTPSQQNARTQGVMKDGEPKEGRRPGLLPKGKPPKKPIDGARTSRLKDGDDPTHEGKVGGINSGKEKGGWSTLPPEEIVKLKEICRLRVNERYRSVIVDYHTALAEAGKSR